MREVVIVSACRTPIGKFNGAFASLSARDLAIAAGKEAIRRAGMEGRVRVLAHDGGPEMRSFLRAGQVDFSVDQNLAYQSYQALSVLLRAVLEHKLPEKEYYHPASPILNAETV